MIMSTKILIVRWDRLLSIGSERGIRVYAGYNEQTYEERKFKMKKKKLPQLRVFASVWELNSA